MAEPFLSEIRLASFNFAPRGWALPNGQLLPINQNQALFSLLGVRFGGNGQTTFALPNYQGKTPMHASGVHTLGETAGEENHTLTAAEIPPHAHTLQVLDTGSSDTNVITPQGNLFSNSQPSNLYSNSAANLVGLAPGSITSVGGSQPHNNMQPYLAITFIIALQGIFPSPN